MLFLHSMNLTQQLISMYTTTVYKKEKIIALNVAKLLELWDIIMPQGRIIFTTSDKVMIKALTFCIVKEAHKNN